MSLKQGYPIMSNGILVDTSVIIDFLRQKDNSGTAFYRLSKQSKKLSISIITHAELYAGKSVWKHKDARIELEKIFRGLTILPISDEISISAGEIRATHGLDLLDALIAATSIIYNKPIATINKAHFGGISGLNLVDLE
jgi:predicted nucleic acid-binding protein